MRSLRFEPATLPAECRALRQEVRAFLREALGGMPPERRALSWTGFDADFSREMGQRGMIGITFPRALGGRGGTHLERYVVIEEALAAGAPVAAHWIGDRQSGPLLLRYGSEVLQRQFVPAIARGEAHFCIGMSEPNSGSDLASVATHAERVEGGYRLHGTKLWSTHVTRCQYMIALVRTERSPARRHDGMTQFLVDLHGPGITVRPIRDMGGHEHFGEVVFEGAFVPQERRIGEEGAGWKQVMAELSFERSGPERFLSSFQLLLQLLAGAGTTPDVRQAVGVGELLARLGTLRQMSLSVAARLADGEDVSVEASVVKELGTTFEQCLPDAAHHLLGTPAMLQGGDTAMRVQGALSQLAPSFSLRGGTREILRGILAKELLK